MGFLLSEAAGGFLILQYVLQSFLPILDIPAKSQLIGFLPTSKTTRCVFHLRWKKLLERGKYGLLG